MYFCQIFNKLFMNKIKLLSILILLIVVFHSVNSFAQEKNEDKLTYKFSGFARGDFYYDDRVGISANEALFYLYPQDISKDANGEDLNAVPHSGFYSFNTRVALDVSGLKVFNANLSAKAEADFAGFSGASALLRLRRAYIKMDWKKSSLLLGQDWTPMFSGAIPEVLSLSTGAPFNAFNRSPQIRFDYRLNHNFTLAGAAIYQLQYNSSGPLDGSSSVKSNMFQRNAILPELYFGVNYKNEGFKAGAGVDYLTLKPRTKSKSLSTDATYKVDETLSSLSYMGYVGYAVNDLSVSAKTIYGQNLSNDCMLGGYGISNINTITGEQEYTNFIHSSSWINIAYGKKYKGNLFAGYTKNLGTDKSLIANSTVYGEGLKMNELSRFCATFSYNIPRFTVGLEYEMNIAGYGDGTINWNKGKYDKTHDVTSNRIVGVISYYF